MPRKTVWLFIAAAPVVLATSPALADDAKTACITAASKAQRFRDTHKLVEAREQLRLCAAAQCPGVVQSDCATWLAQVEDGLPTVVLRATDATGRDRSDVKVTLDGQPWSAALQGEALPIDPGTHALHFEAADGSSVDESILVREGVKHQAVTVVVAKDAAPGAAPATVSPAPVAPTPEPPTSSPWQTAGWVAGAAGVVGLGVGAVFGLKAISDKSGANCDASNTCNAGPLKDAGTAADVSTAAFIAGGVLLAGGAALVLFAPKHSGSSPTTAVVRVTPLVSARSSGLVLGGSW